MSQFKFKLLTGADPDAQYTAVAVKDAYTFYLLKNGKGYLGEIALFGDADIDDVHKADLITNLAVGDYTVEESKVASAKAVVDYVTAQVNDLEVLNASFFRNVQSYTVKTADLTDPAYSLPEGTAADDVGMLFTADNDAVAGGESYYFIPLGSYIGNFESVQDTDTIDMDLTAGVVSANVKLAAGESSILTTGGLSLLKAATVDEGTPSADKLVTEAAVVAYVQAAITAAMVPAVTFTEDTGV